MSLFRRRHPASPEGAAQRPGFAFCETVHATPTSYEHIRLVGEEGLKTGGGVPGSALCGRDLMKGWDLSLPVTVDNVFSLSTPRPGDGRVFLCPKCAHAYREITAPGADIADASR